MARLRGKGASRPVLLLAHLDVDDNRAHGKDERIGVKEYYDGLEYVEALVRELGGGTR